TLHRLHLLSLPPAGGRAPSLTGALPPAGRKSVDLSAGPPAPTKAPFPPDALTPDAGSSPTSAWCPLDRPPGAAAGLCSDRYDRRRDGPTPARRHRETCRWDRG